ncbi:hypothetical protein ABIE78_006063 [Sinorhizobium fredii]|jgi:hypothetical protein|uniref:Uncharacterized protein n=1 Tax=Sinorhizobium fredii (strain USDA 257) TaxID=1185652 RepID=I3XEJ4_SINF2|nr:hypothetical protein USDA257_c57890 [Sinorhizobium fredii USDA 257]
MSIVHVALWTRNCDRIAFRVDEAVPRDPDGNLIETTI